MAPVAIRSKSSAVILETLVYNRDFVDENFDQQTELKGIFTLGEKDKETLKEIAGAKSTLDALVNDIRTLTETLEGEHGLGGKRSQLAALEADFVETCWRLKQRHDDELQDAFAGFRSAKVAFKNKLLTEAKSNSAQLRPLPELERKAATVFGAAPARAVPLTPPDYEEVILLESALILSKRIVGKADVDVAVMIQKLGNSDWVRQGRDFLEVNDKQCPFCQQATRESFAASLNDYFDETFDSETRLLDKLHQDYSTGSERLTRSLEQILVTAPEFLDASKLKPLKDLIETKLRSNLQRIQGKRDEPSVSVELDSLSDALTSTKELIQASNIAINEHNAMVSNLAREKRDLAAQVWKYLLESEIQDDLSKYEKEKDAFTKAIESLSTQIDAKIRDKKTQEARIRELEKETTSIQPTIDEINALLASFGFTSFELAKAGRERFYKLVRPDGTDAKDTLSEGERNFITFLYFFHLLKGSESETGMTTNRVVVFDDPVSSLDSDVLFIVSTLIKGLLDDVWAGSGHIKQIFLLTHNVYFHKEVSFNSRRSNGQKLSNETFWTVRKENGLSVLERHEKNPITTSYELLWIEVRNGGRSNATIQNTLRRILESYFTILGNVDPGAIYAHFEGKEKLICKSLFSWVNAGSHFAHDDLYISGDGATVGTYLTTFRKVFEKTDHLAHYKMMMGDDYSDGAS